MKITRRSFLIGTGSSTIARPASADPSAPTIVADAGSVRINFGRHPAWVLSAQGFGPHAAITADAGRLSISVRNASIAGGASFGLQLDLREARGWRAQLQFDGAFVGRADADLASVMEGRAALEAPLARIRARDILAQTTGLSETKGMRVRIPDRVCLALRRPTDRHGSLDRTLSFGLAVEGRRSAFQFPFQIRASAIRLAPPPPRAAPDWRAELVGTALTRTIPLGRSGSSVAELGLSPSAAVSIIRNPSGEPRLRLSDQMRLDVVTGATREGPVRCTVADLAEVGDDRVASLRLDERRWLIETRHGLFGVSGGVTASNGAPAEAYGATIASKKGHLTFDVPVGLHEHGVPVPGTDLARFDFGGATCRLRIEGSGAPTDGLEILLGTSHGTTTGLALDHAKLRLVEARSLMSLVYRFKDFDLLESGGRRWLQGRLPPVSKGREAGRDPEESDGPLLVVDFPPQHLLEAAYLKQEAVLADRDVAVSAADLRAVHGDSSDRAGAARKKIADAKLSDEACDSGLADIADPKKRPFAAFSKRWADSKKTPPEEIPWIGPQGLLSVAARKHARTCAVKMRTEGLRTLASSLSPPPPDQETLHKAVADALVALALPSLGLSLPALRSAAQSAPASVDTATGAVFQAAIGASDALADLQKKWEAWAAPSPPAFPYFNTDQWPSELASRKVLDAILPESLKGQWPTRVVDASAAPFLAARLRETADRDEADSEATLDLPNECHLSGPSRLAFVVSPDRKAGRGKPATLSLTRDDLTKWTDFELRVVRRAFRHKDPATGKTYPDVAHILSTHGFPVSGDVRLDQWMAKVVDGTDAPNSHETALEIPTRLILSSAQDVLWKTPRPLPPRLAALFEAERNASLWQAEYFETNGDAPGLRAVWSPDFRRANFIDPRNNPPPTSGPYAPWAPTRPTPFRTSIDARDRHELVGLTSLYAIPVLARRDKNGTLDSSQGRIPDGLTLGLQNPDDVALYLPRGLAPRRLSLSSLGASLDLDAPFTPPAPAYGGDGQPLYDTFSLAHLSMRTSYGYDELVEILRKGFLLPLGHTAAFVRTTRREIWGASGPVAFPVQRLSIQVVRTTQTYGQPVQSFEGRNFPARTIDVLTSKTPDLIDPLLSAAPSASAKNELTQNALGRVGGEVGGNLDAGSTVPTPRRALSGLVFWPRTQPNEAGNVRFRMRIDDGADTAYMPLLFLDNQAAHDPDTVKAIVENYYNRGTDVQFAPKRWNVVARGGAGLTYAQPKNPGDTIYATDWLEIDVEGRAGPTPYSFDPTLEGLDQPPFFPKLRQAQITAAQIGRLTGQTAPKALVAFNASYLSSGFASEAPGKAPVMFLDVTGLSPRLDMGKQGDRAGGVGRPSQPVIGFGRDGPVGGPAVTVRSPVSLPSRPIRYAQAGQIMADATPSPSAQGAFFDDNATLLGIITLNRLLGAIADHGDDPNVALPRLKEVTEYAAQVGRAVVDGLRTVVRPLQDAMEKTGAKNLGYDALDKSLSEFTQALDQADDDFKAAAEALPSDIDDDALPADLAVVWASGQRLAGELQRLAQAPLAPALKFLTDTLREVERTWSDALSKFNPVAHARQAAAETLAELAKSDLAPAIIDLGAVVGLPQSVTDNVIAAASDPQTWSAPDPAAVLAAKARAGLPPELAASIDATALRGPLWDRFQTVVDALQPQADQVLSRMGTVLANMREKLDAVRQRYQAIAASAAKLCASGTAAAQAWVRAAMPADAIDPASIASLEDAAASVAGLEGDLRALVADLPHDVRDDAQHLIDWSHDAHGRLDEAATGLADAATLLRGARDDLLKAIGPGTVCALPSGLAAAVDRFDGVRRRWGAAVSAWVAALGVPDQIVLTGAPGRRVQETADKLRAATAAAVLSLQQTSLAATAAAAGTTPSTQLRNLFDADAAIRGILGDADDGVAAAIGSDARRIARLVDDAARQVSAGSEALDESVKAAASFVQQAQDLRGTLEREARALLGRLLDAALSEAAPVVVQGIGTALGAASVAAGAAYGQVLKTRNAAYGTLADHDQQIEDLLGPPPKSARCTGGWIEALLLVNPSDGGAAAACSKDDDALAREAQEVGTPDGFAAALARWSGGAKPAPEILVEQTGAVVVASVRAAVTRILDVEGLRQQLTDALRELVPLRRTLSYDMRLDLSPVDAGFLVLEPDADEAHFHYKDSASVQRDQQKDGPQLVLRSRTTMAFDPIPSATGAPPRPTVSSTFEGTLPRVAITIPDVLKICFQPITFAGGTGRASTLEAKLDRVEIKQELDVLEKLKALLGRSDGGGPYVVLRQDVPAIEAGYLLSVGSFTIGDLAILNINFAAALVLPFDGSDARISLSLGTLDQPFLLSMAPYGGGGFFGLEAGAKGITAGAASFEYGGVAAVDYGPLEAVGRITTGVYVRQSAGSAVLSAIFFAGFSGHVACFGVATTFTLRLAHEDGKLSGTAELDYSFSFGFGHVSFSIKVGRSVDNNLRSASLSGTDGPIRLASSDPHFAFRGQSHAPGGARIKTACTGADEDWFVHEAYYDQGLRPAEVIP